ncbi:hypothetical protein L204_105113 [Cryptococcus depauperatus]
MSALSTSNNEAQDVSQTDLPTGLVHNEWNSTFQPSSQTISANNSNWDPNDFYGQQYGEFVPVTALNAQHARYQSVIDALTSRLTEEEKKRIAAEEESKRIAAGKKLTEDQLAKVEEGWANCTNNLARSENEVLQRGISLQKSEEQHAILEGKIKALTQENEYLRHTNENTTVERDYYLSVVSQLGSGIPTSDQDGSILGMFPE